MQLSWRTLEDTVRSVASLKWKTSAVAKHLGGVDFDAVLEPSQEELVLIEITKRNDLAKVREDIAKINALRISKLTDAVLVRSYLIIEDGPTSSMIETGAQNKVKVLSLADFLNEFFHYDAYIRLRLQRPFGSALNPFTGEPDTIDYIPVTYKTDQDAAFADAVTISNNVRQGKKLVLVGDYGTGKSRCIRRVFESLTADADRKTQVFAIDLRQHWGASSSSEILAGHLEELGMSGSIDNAMQIVASGGAVLLLDGIDEVGAQVFSSNRDSRKSVRRAALEGVRKLIAMCKGGVLITSRSHYFDSDDEMLDATGLRFQTGAEVLHCPEEFSDSESRSYLAQLDIRSDIPPWLPRKPLVFQVLSTLDKDLAESVLSSEEGEFSFWSRFVTAICEREARIHGSIQPDAVRQILTNLAAITREGNSFLGRLTVRAVREAYEKALHDTPDEAGEQMLMRLCTLGRVGPASPIRQFVDDYIVDGLRAEALIRCIDTHDRSVANETWKQPLTRLGWFLLYDSHVKLGREGPYKAMLATLERGNNHQAYAEVFSVLAASPGPNMNVAMTISDCDIYWLAVGVRKVTNLHIRSSYIRNLDLQPEAEGEHSVLDLRDCQIMDMFGVSSADGLPKWIVDSDVERYDSLSNANRIKNSELSAAHTLFLSVVHKIFFQPGKGREERALLKGGFGQKYDPKLLTKILNILIREKIINKIRGDDGFVYTPIRKHTRRMAALKAQMALSGDSLWEEVGNL